MSPLASFRPILAGVWCAGLLCLLAACDREHDSLTRPPGTGKPLVAPTTMEKVRLCRPSVMVLLPVIAEQQGFFADQQLEVAVREFTMGRDALAAMLRGECELAAAAEPPVVEFSGENDDFRILSILQTSDNMVRIVGRADQGIASPADLRGRRLGTVKGTNSQVFLDLFLEQHGIEPEAVTIEFLPADSLAEALAKGRIDALAATTKVVWEARQALGEKAVLLEAPGLYRNYTLLLAQRHFLGQRPETAVRFLRALSQAEEFIAKNPEAAGATASTVQKIPPEAYQEVADSFQHRLGLDHAMLMGLEETNRWIMRRPGAGPARPVPNFIGRLAPDPLGTVRPEAVHLQK